MDKLTIAVVAGLAALTLAGCSSDNWADIAYEQAQENLAEDTQQADVATTTEATGGHFANHRPAAAPGHLDGAEERS